MRRSLPLLLALLVIAVLAGGPLFYKRQHDRHFRNFHVVEEGVLYRSALLDSVGLKRVVRDYRIRTIVSLRDGDRASDQAEAQWAANASIRYVRIPQRAWSDTDGSVPAEAGLETFRRVMQDPANHPVLIHCFAGIHRTGTYCAVFRMDRGWSNRDAIAELRTMGYATIDGDLDVLTFLERYRPAAPALRIQPVSFQFAPAP